METITIQKETFRNFVVDLERLLSDFEKMLDNSLEVETNQRLNELKDNRVKSFSESDYQKHIKKMGV